MISNNEHHSGTDKKDRQHREREEEHLSIKYLDASDRPREKLLAHGVGALSLAELFAILIGNGTRRKTAVELMQDVLDDNGNRLRNLSRMTVEELMRYEGIGEAKALTIIAAAEIGRRRLEENINPQDPFNTADDIHKYMLPRIQDLSHENSWVLLLNNSARLIRCVHLSSGGLTSTLVDVRMLIKEACLANSPCIVLVHNHPSGNSTPSRADKELTNKVKKAAETIDIRMLDHIIVTDHDYYSFADNGQL